MAREDTVAQCTEVHAAALEQLATNKNKTFAARTDYPSTLRLALRQLRSCLWRVVNARARQRGGQPASASKRSREEAEGAEKEVHSTLRIL